MDEGTGGWTAGLPEGRSDRVRAIAPVVLLVAVALLGVRNHVTRDQSSWQGASFGMFATFDNGVSRAVVVKVESSDGESRVILPTDLRDDADRLAVVPSERAAARLAAVVLARVDDATAVTVEVRRVVLDDDKGLEVSLATVVTGKATR